ncbi:hypothetical protein [Pseudorhodobacter sp.]|uniref:hypothetical protein n=1 Tax=Pseudorhodobacter sp. TaxID=1934400 RepID=UPI002647726F|nr:hypothetical protein [Pseudorhodobacter sp.]MDN5785911.1 hypothetical protein [Pseudorhodobacter sp.]
MPVAELSLSAPAVAFHGNAIASDPSVIRVNGEYLMFYTDLDYQGVRTAISVASSVDGENWTRIMAPGDAGGSVLCGAQSFETAAAAMIDGQLVLYVSEYDETAANGLDASIFAYKVNPDFSVEPFAPGPVIAPVAGGADEDAAFSPTVFAYDGGYVMYYVGHDYFESDSTGVSLLSATSPDGITWTPSSEPVLSANDAPSWASDGIAEPSVVIGPDQRVHLFYTALQGENRSIGHAIADHIGAAFEFAQAPLLTPADCPGDVMQILAPASIVENGELRLWFFAYDASGGYSILNSSAAFGPDPSEESAETPALSGNENLPLGSVDTGTVAIVLDDTPISDQQTTDAVGGDDRIDAGLGSATPALSENEHLPLGSVDTGAVAIVLDDTPISDQQTTDAVGGDDRIDAGLGLGSASIDAGLGSASIDGSAGVDMIGSSTHSDAEAISQQDDTAPLEPDTIPISNVENITGSRNDDVLTGDANANWLRGLAGNDQFIATDGADTYDGSTGRDMVTYINATAAVTVDLGQQRGLAGQAADHIYLGIEQVRGSNFADIFYGSADDDDFFGAGGKDTFYDSDGRDRYVGGGGQDTVSYAFSNSRVIASLSRGIGGPDSDRYNSIENLTGSDGNDRLSGDHGRNILLGGLGDDTLRGGHGNDTLFGHSGNDSLEGGVGDDVLNGGSGYDVALYRDVASHYTVTTAGDVTTVSHLTEGIDTLTGIEALSFSDIFIYL